MRDSISIFVGQDHRPRVDLQHGSDQVDRVLGESSTKRLGKLDHVRFFVLGEDLSETDDVVLREAKRLDFRELLSRGEGSHRDDL